MEEIYPTKAYAYENFNSVVELQVNFDPNTRVLSESIGQLLLLMAYTGGIVGFELLGTKERITLQFVCTSEDINHFKSCITAYTPGVVINETQGWLDNAIDFSQSVCVTDLGLRDEFMRPLRTWNKFDPDPLAGCIASLGSLGEGEFGMLQVLFQGAVNPWTESIYRSVTDGAGGPFFVDSPEMLHLAKEKVGAPLFAVVIRTIGQSPDEDRAVLISQTIAQSLIAYHRPGSNTLIPLSGPPSCDAMDLVRRRSKRIGMLLNGDELASIVHIPDRSVISPKLRVYVGKT